MDAERKINECVSTSTQNDAIVRNQIVSTGLVNIDGHLVDVRRKSKVGTDSDRLFFLKQVDEAHPASNGDVLCHLQQSKRKRRGLLGWAVSDESRGKCVAGSELARSNSANLGLFIGGIGDDAAEGRIHQESFQRKWAALWTGLFRQCCGTGHYRRGARRTAKDCLAITGSKLGLHR